MNRLCILAGLSWLLPTARAQPGPFEPCPIRCSKAGQNPSDWTHLHGKVALTRCPKATLFDLSIYTPVEDPDSHITFRACTAEDTSNEPASHNSSPFIFSEPQEQRQSEEMLSTLGCLAGTETFRNTTNAQIVAWHTADDKLASRADAVAAVETINGWLENDEDCHSSIMFARAGQAVIGLYVGDEIHKPSASGVVKRFIATLKNDATSLSSRVAAQLCQEKTPRTWSMGIFADLSGNISAAQEAVRNWHSAECLNGADSTEIWKDLEISMVKAADVPTNHELSSGFEQKSEPLKERSSTHELVTRADCKAIQVVAGDGCYSLAKRCGISQDKLKSFNSKTNKLCDIDTLKAGQWVCCSKGDLPDFSPKQNKDGTCATHTITSVDICWNIMEKYYLTEKKLNDYNKNTWGWAGCKNLQQGQKICLSKGDPPMPNSIPNAICGPQVPGTKRPNKKTQLKDLNHCPLNACCNFWGQCGLTNDFCVEAPADTKAPGTSKPGKNGCIASCGMKITNNKDPPSSFSSVAYFEAWNKERKCLHMDVTDIKSSEHTHIHFAFGLVTPDFKVDVSKVKTQFDKLKKMKGIKRILSFGGWAFSTEAPTYTIFRDGVTAANRAALASSVVEFINKHDLDGVDFDWEYPAAPDIPGIPPGILQNGKDYLEFLKLVKRKLPKKSVSIAAPASYWYLKGFPIKEIAGVVDYIVYMTYDLHGQWDYGNKWSSPGCETGNCLRSHINITETELALAMVTKAGVPAKKVFVGISSYGRSFKMANPSCTGPMCKFTGSATHSNAEPGQCTNTSGYIAAAEIRELLFQGEESEYTGTTVKTFYDASSKSDIVVYNGDNWVAWMTDKTKKDRIKWIKGLNFGGTSDWAVDLDKDYGSTKVGESEPGDQEGKTCNLSKTFDSLEALEKSAASIQPGCKAIHTLIVLQKMMDKALDKYSDVNNGYDSKFKSYRKYMNDALPVQLRNWMYFTNGPGQKYFDCKFKGNGNTYEGPCPVPRDVRGGLMSGIWDLKYTLKDKKGFEKALLDDLGIDPSWVEFGGSKEKTECQQLDHPTLCNSLDLSIHGQPKIKKDFQMPDPKDIIKDALRGIKDLRISLGAAMADIGLGLWKGSNEEVVSVLSMPVFLLVQAVEAMEDAKDIGEEIQEQEEKNRILTIITAVLFFVPFLGELTAAAAGMAGLARAFAIGSLGADAALSIVDIVKDPSTAPMAIAGMLLGGRIKSPKEYREAFDLRSKMKPEDVTKVGEIYKKNEDTLKKIIQACKR